MAKKNRFYSEGYMVKNDPSQIANMPKDVITKEYPSATYYPDTYLDDSMHGIDRQMAGVKKMPGLVKGMVE